MWSMLTMGSGTAFVALAILSLYFLKRQYALTAVPLLAVIYFLIPHIDVEPLQRAKVTMEAVMTMDQQNVIKADGSAAVRVVPLMNTFTKLDLMKAETWFGKGVDGGGDRIKSLSEESTIGGISSHGLISYIFALAFLYTCVIHKFFSLETLLCFVLFGLTISNFAYIWGIFIIQTTANYFMTNSNELNTALKKQI